MDSTLRRELLAALRLAEPPSRAPLSEWMKANFQVVQGAEIGLWKPWAPQTAIADAIGNSEYSFVTVLKGIRVGYTTMLTGAVLAIIDRSPGPILMVQPRDEDCRGYVVDTLEPSIEAINRLSKTIDSDIAKDRQTIRDKRFPGGSFKIRAATSAANLRRIGAKYLFLDEVDAEGYGNSAAEGDRIAIAIGRTIEYADRKIVMGSTPTTESASRVYKSWLASDQRKYFVHCLGCGKPSEILWDDIIYDPEDPRDAKWRCPSCEHMHRNSDKIKLVADGKWVPTRHDVKGHAGFHFSGLYSLHANMAWGELAADWEKKKKAGLAERQVFVNQILALPWAESMGGMDPDTLAGRREDTWGADHLSGKVALPPDVLLLTAGVDTQDSWFEIVLLGWSRSQIFVIDHHVINGSTKSDSTWLDLHAYLRTVYDHPLGGRLEIMGAAVDAGGHATDEVYKYTMSQNANNVWAIFGRRRDEYFVPQPRSKKNGRIHAIIGVNKLKEDLIDRLQIEPSERRAVRFGKGLQQAFFQGLTAEQKIIRRRNGIDVIEWEQIRERNEALDAMVYAMGVRYSARCRVDFDEVEKQLRESGRIAVEGQKTYGRRIISRGLV